MLDQTDYSRLEKAHRKNRNITCSCLWYQSTLQIGTSEIETLLTNFRQKSQKSPVSISLTGVKTFPVQTVISLEMTIDVSCANRLVIQDYSDDFHMARSHKRPIHLREATRHVAQKNGTNASDDSRNDFYMLPHRFTHDLLN